MPTNKIKPGNIDVKVVPNSIIKPFKLKTPKATKSASIVFFYLGDSKITTAFQETTKLKNAMKGYSKVVLLKDDDIPNMFDLSKADERKADIKDQPTKANLFKYIKQLCKEGYYIDLWIWAHGMRSGYFTAKGEGVYASDIEKELSSKKTGFKAMPLRMVYSIACWGYNFNKHWIKAGAKTAIGTRYVNFYPTQFGGFSNHWNKYKSVAASVKGGNTAASRTLVQIALSRFHAPATNKEWGKCKLGTNVLGTKPCAETYFRNQWSLSASEFRSSKSGKWNMNNSSQYIYSGSSRLTKKSKPKW